MNKSKAWEKENKRLWKLAFLEGLKNKKKNRTSRGGKVFYTHNSIVQGGRTGTSIKHKLNF